MPLRNLAQFPYRVLESFTKTLEAFRIAHCSRFPVRVRQHKVIDQVGEALSLDRDAQLFHVGEVGRSQAAWRMFLREKHFLGRPLGRPPPFHTTLQSAQLPVGKLAWRTPLQELEYRLGFQPGVDFQKLANLSPDFDEWVRLISPTADLVDHLQS